MLNLEEIKLLIIEQGLNKDNLLLMLFTQFLTDRMQVGIVEKFLEPGILFQRPKDDQCVFSCF